MNDVSYKEYDEPAHDPARERIDAEIENMSDIEVIKRLTHYHKSYEMLMDIARTQLFDCLYGRSDD